MDKHNYRKVFSALLAFLLLALLTGCGCSGPSPEEVIARAIDAINEPQTYRLEMTVTRTQDGETKQGNMQGEFVSPNRLHLITVSDSDTGEGIRIGQTEYRRVPDSDSWEICQWPPSRASTPINPALDTVEILDTLVGLVKLRDEKIDGVSCFHYSGSSDVDPLIEEQIANIPLDPTQPGYEELVGTIEQHFQSEQTVEFWVGKEDYLLRRMDTQYELEYTRDAESGGRITATYSFIFYDFNEPIQIEPPVVE